ncbi:MAG: hypothetical protein ACRDP6_39090 [Actinoallomurus sp.]
MVKLSGSVNGSGPSEADRGGIANSGIHVGDNNILVGSPVAKSPYVKQVEQMAPSELVDRSKELEELGAFCTADRGCRWVWWQAPAWAGKSALMSWFVLHPPDGVRVVSFFITARWPGNNDRAAFVNVVLEQLAELAGQPVPPYLTDATREAHLLDLLEKAAQACQDEGERLVLVVDGLDEDRGVTVGPDAYSIAALLPARLPDGVRVVVAGRPNPPIPPDVQPEDHPLRDRRIVRPLASSKQARVIEVEAQRELKELLHGALTQQNLLGLVTAAGGGLSDTDLAWLARLPTAEIEDHLHTVSGRTFSRRVSGFQPDAGPVVYVLAHEELQNTAVAYLGETRLAEYRQRLHEWAGRYRNKDWPPGTPEYLLRGYYRLLHAHGDVARMVACGTDQARHDRMLDIAGGDAAALSEITTVQDLICAHPDPDLTAMLRLSIARDRLADRNAYIPIALPAVWARLGYLTRAEALARSITAPVEQAQALAGLVKVVRAAGDLGRAKTLAGQVAALARSIHNPHWQALAQTQATLAKAVAAGDPDWAEPPALTAPYRQAAVLAELVRAVEAAGDLGGAQTLAGQVEALARSIHDPYWRAQELAMLADLVKALATGDLDQAETIARSITDPDKQAQALADLANVAAVVGDLRRAQTLANEAETLARSITDSAQQASALTELIKTVAAAGDLGRAQALSNEAETLVLSITDPDQQAWALAKLAKAVAVADDADRAKTSGPDKTRRLLALALRCDSWTTSLKALARIAPAVVIAAVDDIRRL